MEWSLKASKIHFTDEYKLSHYFNGAIPPGFTFYGESGICDSFMAIRLSGQFQGKINSIRQVVEDDKYLFALQPRFIKKWEIIWREKQINGMDFIRQVQIGDFLPMWNVYLNAYGLAMPGYNRKTNEYSWNITVLSHEDMKTVTSFVDLPKNDAKDAVAKKWVELTVPFCYCKVKPVSTAAFSPDTNTLLAYETTLVCKLSYLPFAMYRDILLASAIKSVVNLAEFAVADPKTFKIVA